MPTLRRPTSRRHQRGLTAWRGRCKCNSAQTRIHDASGQLATYWNRDPYLLQPTGDAPSGWNAFINWWRALFKLPLMAQPLSGTSFAYDQEGRLIGQYSSTGAQSHTEYIWLPTATGSIPVALLQAGQTYAIHSDHLDTPRIITNAQAQVVWQWEYSGFGEEPPQTTTHAPNGFHFNLRYPGQYFDAESGLFDNWHRTYDPESGRYTSADPIGLNGGWNRFAYVDNNAIWASDPMGLQAYMCSAGLAAWCPPPDKPKLPPNFPYETKYCVTAECAAGLLPAKSDNRTIEEIDTSLCEFKCNMAASVTPPFGSTILAKIASTLAISAGSALSCKAICKPRDNCKQ